MVASDEMEPQLFKDILVHVDASEAGQDRLRLALRLATTFDARLCGLHVAPPVEVPPSVKASMAEEVGAVLQQDIETAARVAEAVFREIAGEAKTPKVWRAAQGDVARLVSEHARYADLVIVGQYERQGTAERHPLPISHSVALHCGRPVLVLPARTDPDAPFTRILIAWDGSREAVRAVHDALPFLQRAQSVRVAVANPEREGVPAEVLGDRRLADHLRRRGVPEIETVVLHRPDSVAGVVERHLGDERFDLLVMGAYSRPMWYEFLTGGVTQSLLLSSKTPLFVSH